MADDRGTRGIGGRDLLGLGGLLVGGVVGGLVVGLLIDRAIGSDPVGALVGLACGAALALTGCVLRVRSALVEVQA